MFLTVAGCPVSSGVYPPYSHSTWRPPTSPNSFTVGPLHQSRQLHQPTPEPNSLFPSSGGSCYPQDIRSKVGDYSWRY